MDLVVLEVLLAVAVVVEVVVGLLYLQ